MTRAVASSNADDKRRRSVAGSKADDKRRRLVEAGLELMEDLPYAEITVAMVAEKAGMARSLVFYYFEDKEALFHSVVRDFLDQVRRLFEANDLSDVPDTKSWMRREVDIFLDFMAAHPQAMATIMSLGWEVEPDGTGSTMMDYTAGRVQQAMGLPPQDELMDAALHSWAYHCVDLAIRTQQSSLQSERAVVAAILVDQLEAVLNTLNTAERAVESDLRKVDR
jgi:AcrR family transcriptional regulator